jgi:hypothetical protein
VRSEPIEALALDDEHSQATRGFHLVFFASVQVDRFARLDRLIVAVRPAYFA